MKKIALSLGLLAVLSSCSDSDSDNPIPSNPSNDILVRQIVFNAVTDDYTETVDYTYNGNKLVMGVYDHGAVETYTYDGDLITKIEVIADGDPDYTETFDYDNNGRLIGFHIVEGTYEEHETFVYNADGTVTSTLDPDGFASERTFHFLNDELIKIVEDGGPTYNYTYDGKNSPFRNVTGYNKIAHVSHGDHEFFGRHQNISMVHDQTNDIDYMTNSMTYDANNYPTFATSVAVFAGDGTYTATMQYTY